MKWSKLKIDFFLEQIYEKNTINPLVGFLGIKFSTLLGEGAYSSMVPILRRVLISF